MKCNLLILLFCVIIMLSGCNQGATAGVKGNNNHDISVDTLEQDSEKDSVENDVENSDVNKQIVFEANPEYFDECIILADPSTVVEGITTSGSSKSSINGVVTDVEYTYYVEENAQQKYTEYIAYLEGNGVALRYDSEKTCSVLDKGMKAASVELQDSTIRINIIPENFRVVAVVKEVKVGSKESFDFTELTFNAIEISKEVYPEDTSGVYLYYEETTGSSYVTLRGYVKNLANENLSSDYINASLVINEKYSYLGDVVFGANSASMTDYAITPFEESPLYVVFSVPNEAISKMTTGTLSVRFNDNFERGGAEYAYTLIFNVPK